MLSATISGVLVAMAMQLPPQVGSIHGQIRGDRTAAVISGATVEVVDVRPRRAVASDSSGRYQLANVRSGRRTLRVHRPGYAPLEMEVVVPSGRGVALDIALRSVPIVLAPMHVRGGRQGGVGDTTSAAAADLSIARARALQSSPGLAELGLAEAIAGPPGQDPGAPSDALYVRGTGTDLKVVHLDGAPVQSPFPLGGLLEPFTPGLLSSADVFLGGAPAKYDGGLSYLLDLRTRGARAERMHVSGAVDMLAARALVETPVGSRAGLLASVRGVHDTGTRWVSGDVLPYGYREGLVRGDLSLGRHGDLSATIFGNEERVWVDSLRVPGNAIAWGNVSGSVRYSGEVGATSLEFTAATGEFAARMPIAGSRAQPAEGRLAEGWSRRSRLAMNLSTYGDAVTVRYGGSIENQHQEYRSRSTSPVDDWSLVGRAGDAWAAGVYVDGGVQIGDRVSVRGGLRADHFSLATETLLAPRLAATFLVTERAALTLAAGRYHQYVRPANTAVFGADGTPLLLAPDALALARANHLSVGLNQELGQAIELGLEGFVKEFEGIPGSAGGNASGVDLWVRRGTGAWQGWLGYSVSWTRSVDDSRERHFNGRHLLTSGLTAPLGRGGQLNLGVAYGAGLPYSAIPFASDAVSSPVMALGQGAASVGVSDALNAGSAPLLGAASRPYLRVDLGVSHTWSPDWGQSRVAFTPYLRLLNTLGQRDALFYRGPEDGQEGLRPAMMLAVVPIVGLEWSF